MQNVLVFTPKEKCGPAQAIAGPLRQAGYRVVCACLDGERQEAVETLCGMFTGRPPDLLVADLSRTADCLPLHCLRRLLIQCWGEEAPHLPCLALFEQRHLLLPDWPTQVDDFLLPPYESAEALARLALLLFRHRSVRDANILRFTGVTLDLDGRLAYDTTGKALPLTPREFELLRFLVTHQGKFFGRDRLLDLVWGVEYEGGERTVDIHIRRLRAKLPPAALALLQTRRGGGYGLLKPS